MSAFIVTDYHINALVTWGVYNKAQYWLPKERRWVYFNSETAPAIAALLYSENVRSVNSRYNERSRRTGFRYIFEPSALRLRPDEIIKACDCLDYQSCETKSWKNTQAYKALQSIREEAISALTKTTMTWTLSKPEAVEA